MLLVNSSSLLETMPKRASRTQRNRRQVAEKTVDNLKRTSSQSGLLPGRGSGGDGKRPCFESEGNSARKWKPNRIDDTLNIFDHKEGDSIVEDYDSNIHEGEYAGVPDMSNKIIDEADGSKIGEVRSPIQHEPRGQAIETLHRKRNLRDQIRSNTTPLRKAHIIGSEHEADIELFDEVSSSLSPHGDGKATMKALFSKLESVLLEKLDVMEEVLGKRLSKVETELCCLRKAMEDAKTTGLSIYKEQSSKSTALSSFIGKLKHATRRSEWIFDERTLSRVLRLSVSVCVVDIVSKEEGDESTLRKEAFHTLMFSLLPGGKCEEWKRGVGLRHSKMRKMIVVNTIFNAQNNKFGKFLRNECEKRSAGGKGETKSGLNDGKYQRENDIEQGDSSLSTNDVKGRIVHPRWLRPGYVTIDDICAAQTQHEETLAKTKDGKYGSCKSNGSWYEIKEIPTRGDIATYGVFRLFSIVKASLNVCRRNAKRALFEHLLYLMVPWKDHNIKIDQCFVHLKWAGQKESNSSLSKIPLAKDITCDQRTADEYNSQLYSRMLANNESLLLLVKHETYVGETVGKRKRNRRVSLMEIRKVINLVDVAGRFCAAFTGVNDKEHDIQPFLRASEVSLRCIISIAEILRDLVNAFMKSSVISDGKICFPVQSSWGQVGLDEVTDGRTTSKIVLEDLVPCQSERQRLLNSRCLHVTPEIYKELNIPVTEGLTRIDESNSLKSTEKLDQLQQKNCDLSELVGVYSL